VFGTETLLQVLVKDFCLFLLVVIFLFCEETKTLVHPDNWQAFSRLLTPSHIEPEIYFFVKREAGVNATVGIFAATVFALQLLNQFSAILLEFSVGVNLKMDVNLCKN